MITNRIIHPEDTMPMACEPCRVHKRKCDRAIPSCGRCKTMSRRCSYDPYRLARAQLQVTERAHRETTGRSDGSAWARHRWETTAEKVTPIYITWSPSAPDTYPIEFRPYMPQLIRQFCQDTGVAWANVSARSTAYKFQSVWLQHALSDPCLFHATLYTASSYLDIVRGDGPTPITLLHQNELIRHVNERLSDPVWAVDDRTIASICPLALYANLTGDQVASEIHGAGLRKLIKLKGGVDKLGLDGLVATLTHMNDIVQTVVFDSTSDLIPQGYHVVPPLGLETRILDITTHSAVPESSDPVVTLFHDVYSYKLGLTRLGDSRTLPSCRPFDVHHGENPIYWCCYLATEILWFLSDSQAPSMTSSSQLAYLTSNLKDSLVGTEDAIWLQSHPVAYTWVCMTGAAAAPDTNSRIWFYAKQSSTMRALNTAHDFSFLDDIWAHFYWLRNRRFRLSVVEGVVE